MILAIQLDRASREPLYRQIESQLRASIQDGRLRSGALLPGVRTLAGQLGVARITIVTAYEQLASEGLLEARVGSGTRVAETTPRRAARTTTSTSTSSPSWHPARRDARAPTPSAYAIDLRPGGLPPDPASAAAWESALRGAWRQLAARGGADAPGSTERHPAGDPDLRALIAERIGATRGIRCSAADVVIVAGRGAAFAALAEILLPAGAAAVVEDPADPRASAALESAGARLIPVPVDVRGLRTELLPASAAIARVTPAWQERAGGSLSLDRRLDLLAWAARSGATIVEDDTGAELRLQGTPPPALRSMDPSAEVVVVDAIEDVLFPGLGIAAVVASGSLAARLAERLEPQGRTAPPLVQRALARMLEDGHVDRHLRRLRLRLAERQAALIHAIEQVGDGRLRTGPGPAGRHLAVTVTDPTISARTMAARAVAAGVLVTPLAAQRRLGGADRDLLVGFGAESPDRIEEGVRRLVAAIDDGARRGAVPGAPEPSRESHRARSGTGPLVPKLVVALE